MFNNPDALLQVAISDSPETIPLSILLGIGSGGILGWALYRSTSRAHMHHFIIFSSSLLFLVGAGMLSLLLPAAIA